MTNHNSFPSSNDGQNIDPPTAGAAAEAARGFRGIDPTRLEATVNSVLPGLDGIVKIFPDGRAVQYYPSPGSYAVNVMMHGQPREVVLDSQKPTRVIDIFERAATPTTQKETSDTYVRPIVELKGQDAEIADAWLETVPTDADVVDAARRALSPADGSEPQQMNFTYYDEATGETQTVNVDPAVLVASGVVGVTRQPVEKKPGGTQVGTSDPFVRVRMGIGVVSHLKDVLESGLEPGVGVMLVGNQPEGGSGEHALDLEDIGMPNGASGMQGVYALDGQHQDTRSKEEKADEIIRLARKRVSDALDLIGRLGYTPHRVEVRPLAESLEQVTRILGERGRTLVARVFDTGTYEYGTAIYTGDMEAGGEIYEYPQYPNLPSADELKELVPPFKSQDFRSALELALRKLEGEQSES